MTGVQTCALPILKDMKNVAFLGIKQHSELAEYIDRFDVCLIPYLLNDYTETVYPTKLNEYLARGKAVVSTALPERSEERRVGKECRSRWSPYH